MIVDIYNLDSIIRGYIINTVKEYYPDVDTSENSVFDDLFIKPLIEYSRPFLNTLSRLELKTSLANAKYLDESELDEIGEGNYFLKRKNGTFASTNITLTFANINLEDPDFVIKIPTGAIFTNGSDEIEFQTQGTIVLTADDMQAAYNKQKLIYEIDIPVYASKIGKGHNVFAGELTYCKTFFSNALVSVVNKMDVVNGKDKESNEDYAERIKEFYLSRQLGTAPGYRNFIMDLFEEINDVYVSGYKDKYMERDKLKVVSEDGAIYEKHVGGAVDLYLKGCLYDENFEEITLNNNVLLLECDYEALVDNDGVKSIKIINLTDSTKTPKIELIDAVDDKEFFGSNKGKTKVIIRNQNEESYTEGVKSAMKATYRFMDDNDNIVVNEYYFDIGITKVELAAPVKSVDALIDPYGGNIPDVENRVTTFKEGIHETTNESCEVVIDNCEDYYNGMPIKVKYTGNKTLRSLKSTLENEKTRIVTADVVGFEAKPVLVNVQFKVKTTFDYNAVDIQVIESRIKASIVSFFNAYRLGDSIEASDLVGWLYTDPSTKDMIQYIALPFLVFYIPKTADEDIPDDGSQIHPEGVLGIEATEYPVLNAGKFRIDVI